jgi:hypothetical protein
VAQPNEALSPPALCVAANNSLSYSGGWGWANWQCSEQLPYVCKVAAPGVFSYSSPMNATYVLNTNPLPQAAAEQFCRDRGGHLASFTTFQEQVEVEAWFAQQGYLLPAYHG